MENLTVADRYARIKEKVANAAVRSGRTPDSVKIVAVSKTVCANDINQAIMAGAKLIGESRVQDWLAKKDEILPAELHWIGHLQTNKVKKIIDQVKCIHSVDRIELAQSISDAALSTNVEPISVLIEVNLAEEENKSGVTSEGLFRMLDGIADFKGIRVVGLMCIPPQGESRKFFTQLRELAQKAQLQKIENMTFDELSMGMSADFEEAIEEGSTIVRVGTAIFGNRLYV